MACSTCSQKCFLFACSRRRACSVTVTPTPALVASQLQMSFGSLQGRQRRPLAAHTWPLQAGLKAVQARCTRPRTPAQAHTSPQLSSTPLCGHVPSCQYKCTSDDAVMMRRRLYIYRTAHAPQHVGSAPCSQPTRHDDDGHPVPLAPSAVRHTSHGRGYHRFVFLPIPIIPIPVTSLLPYPPRMKPPPGSTRPAPPVTATCSPTWPAWTAAAA